ncbi:hypothetical protein ACVWW3_003476 [Bradyrhizobium sp. LM2.9]
MACGQGRGVTEIAIGREAPPGLVATVEQVEHDRTRHERDHRAADIETATLLGEPGLHAAAGLDPEGGAAGQRDRIDPFLRAGKIEQGILAGTRSAAADVDRRDRRLVEDDRGRARGEFRILGMADADAGDIGEKVFQDGSAG